MESEQNRFRPQQRRKRWVGCWRALSCFGKPKRERRIVPTTRMSERNAPAPQQNGSQASGFTTQNASLFAPPSSPASFSNSALPSTVQSPSCLLSLSANSPGGPSSTMFATGPYAHETQLVSPPVFSTFTTEPSTAPFTPPPELAHLTTPSSPDVPFARFLTSSADLKNTDKTNYVSANDLQATYPLYIGSPASSLRSPISRASGDGLSSSFPKREFPPHWDPLVSPRTGNCSRSDSSNALTPETTVAPKASRDSNFFCPTTFARFYLDYDAPFSHTGGRLSVSKDSDVYPTSGNGNQQRQTKSVSKQDMEELEAYRASFGFSADEIITTNQYVEISDVMDGSFSMRPFESDTPKSEVSREPASPNEGQKSQMTDANLVNQRKNVSESHSNNGIPDSNALKSFNSHKDHMPGSEPGIVSGSSTPRNGICTNEEDLSLTVRTSRKYHMDICSSDAEIDYRRRRSRPRVGKGNFAWHV